MLTLRKLSEAYMGIRSSRTEFWGTPSCRGWETRRNQQRILRGISQRDGRKATWAFGLEDQGRGMNHRVGCCPQVGKLSTKDWLHFTLWEPLATTLGVVWKQKPRVLGLKKNERKEFGDMIINMELCRREEKNKLATEGRRGSKEVLVLWLFCGVFW